MSCDNELANEWARCSGKNASYITIQITALTAKAMTVGSARVLIKDAFVSCRILYSRDVRLYNYSSGFA